MSNKEKEVLSGPILTKGREYREVRKKILPATRIQRGLMSMKAPETVAREEKITTFKMHEILSKRAAYDFNQERFDEIKANRLRPYRVIEHALRATSTRMETKMVEEEVPVLNQFGKKVSSEKRLVPKNVMVEVPDHATRLKAAQIKLLLVGADPRAHTEVKQGPDGGINVWIGDMFANVGKFEGEDAITEYNKAKRAELDGTASLVPIPVNDGATRTK